MCFTGTGGMSENKFLAVFKATNCVIQLHRMLFRIVIDPFVCTSGAVTTILSICQKATTLSIKEKAKSPEI
jgi:hypothetical protein